MPIPQIKLREHLYSGEGEYQGLPTIPVTEDDLEPGQHFCKECNGHGYKLEFKTGKKHECQECGWLGFYINYYEVGQTLQLNEWVMCPCCATRYQGKDDMFYLGTNAEYCKKCYED